ncbi:MAG TPA: hypothetical protein PKM36_09425 [Propionibacteriaceae bacterium]|nr:hypothetical protein [Propionibacteriaceae bacterium]
MVGADGSLTGYAGGLIVSGDCWTSRSQPRSPKPASSER